MRAHLSSLPHHLATIRLKSDRLLGEAVAQVIAARGPLCLGYGCGVIVSATGPAIALMPLADVTEEDFERVYATDVRGAFKVLKHGGRTLENDGISACPKTAVAAMVKQTAREMGRYNLRCNGIAPAVIDAGIIYAPEFAGKELAQGVISAMVANTPRGRMWRPEEISAVVDFLLSPGAAYINRQIIGVDGGFSA